MNAKEYSNAIEVLKGRALPIFGKEYHKGKMFVQVDWIDHDLKEVLLALEEKENDKLLGAVEYSKRIKHRLREMELQGKTIIRIAELIEVINTLEKEALGVLQNGK